MRQNSVYRAVHVPVSTTFGFAGRNLLWKVHELPVTSSHSQRDDWKVSHTCHLPAHLFLCDDGEGYRLTWCAPGSWQRMGQALHRLVDALDLDRSMTGIKAPTAASLQWRTPSRPIVIPISDHEPPYWRLRWSDRQSGCAWLYDDDDDDDDDEVENCNPTMSTKTDTPRLSLVHEAQFLILSLLSDILERRPSLRPPSRAATNHKVNHHSPTTAPSFSLPDFAYELVSISHGGRVAKLVLGFPMAQKERKHGTHPASHHVAVLVALDLWTQQYLELQWVKSPNHVHSSSLAKHVQKLALDFRAQELVSATSDDRRRDDLDALFPDCDVFSNRNVLRGLPVMSIPSRSPVEIVYG